MWSPSGAVGRGVLDNTCSPARFHFVFTNVTLCHDGSVLQPTLSPSTRHPSSLQASYPFSGFLLKLKGEVSASSKDPFFCKMIFYFGFCTAGNFWWGGVGLSAVETRLQIEMLTTSSPGSCSLSPVAASPARISENGIYSCLEMPHGDARPKHQLPFSGDPCYQRKDFCPAAGRGMNPRQCVKTMWGLVNRHGLGMKHSQSHGIRHTACRKDNRWHENPLFSPPSSRRSYWWETCQNFPESQSLSKVLLYFHDSEIKYFQSVSITVASPAAEDSPHLLHMVTSNQGET